MQSQQYENIDALIDTDTVDFKSARRKRWRTDLCGLV